MLRATMVCLTIAAFAAGVCFATPSTLVWIPSTDIQSEKTFHLGADDLINLGTTDKITSDSTLLGLTYGFSPEFELGIDYLSGVSSPVTFNAKYGFGPFGRNNEWAAAFGGYMFGSADDSADIIYGLISYQLGQDRFHLGYFSGDSDSLTDPVTGKSENDGLLLGWDRSFGDKWWAAVDYQGGESAFGALSAGVAYSLSDSAAILAGGNFFNSNAIDNTLTIQFDIDFD